MQLHLLARAIALPLDPPVSATAEPPPHMRAALVRCGWVGPPAPNAGADPAPDPTVRETGQGLGVIDRIGIPT